MKKWTALFLAFVLALSLPLIFATNEFDAPEHDHDGECDLCGAGGDSPMWFWDYCSTCQIVTTQETTNKDEYEYYDDTYHRCITYEVTECLECGSTLNREYLGDAWVEHSFNIPHEPSDLGVPGSACICGAVYYGK